FLVNAYTTGSQTEGRIAMTGDGRFVVVWTSYPQDGSLQGVFGRRFGPSGNPLGAEFQVNTITTGAQYAPAVDVARDGSFVVAWLQSDGSDQGVFAQRFDAAGTRVGSELQVNTFTTNRQRTPAVSTNERGDFVVVWESFLQDGSVQGIFGQRFDRNGTRVGGEFQVNAYTTGLQWNAHVDADEVGNFTVAWGSLAQDGDSFGVYAQRFGGILFTALGLDATPTLGPYRAPFASDGNGVLEPGEVVTVETSWTNVSGLAQTLTGFVSSFTGPPGPTYSVPDAFADFGVIPHGATVSCAVTGDCYRLGVSGTRPATHWDGVMTEGPTNIILGQAKLWDIHVGDSFTDVPRSSPYYRFIETLLHHGITGGCAASEYCPQGSTTREQMAVFVTVAASGPLFVPPACGAVPLFADVPPASPYCRWVEELARRGVVAGCGGGNYCPSDPVSREQMAVFVLRALDGTLDPPACTTPLFADVPASSPFCRWVEELARRGVVSGCGGGNYCPADAVTREQMAVFVLRALEPTLSPPVCTAPVFADVPASSPFCRWIEELARRGVVSGCAPGLYCPTQPVTREQMGVFLSLTFGLSLYGV
ncbi:MAG TPA: S-layer homology domain-containing protein, partial [Vicinamibacteria bacterium]|nr:S-layer homology domain-containing protein [Vicinamibacteria bacterium]